MGNSYPNSRENRSSSSANCGHNLAGTDSSAEFNRLSFELKLSFPKELDEVMNSVSVQIQRAINDAISNQVSPQIQNAIRAGSRPLTQKGWNLSTGRPGRDAEDNSNQKMRSSSRSEPFSNRLHDENADSTHDTKLLTQRKRYLNIVSHPIPSRGRLGGETRSC